jgi:sec-independent protein translocase protein TatC
LSNEDKNGELGRMGILDHLEELRSTLISVIATWLATSIVLWFFSGYLLDFLLSGIPVESLYFHAPAEAFLTRMKLSFIAGFLISFPYVLFRIWSFVSPGLFASEKKLVVPLIVPSAALFYLGVVFAYWVMVPVTLNFLIKFGTGMLSPLISVEKYFSFVGRLCFAFGIVFQLPLIIIFLTIAGLISPKQLLRQWRWVVLAIFTAGAVLTPPDPASQLLMALPLLALFFASVLVAVIIKKSNDKKRE